LILNILLYLLILPCLASVLIGTIGAHPTGLGEVDAGVNCIEYGHGYLGEAFTVLGGADGIDLLQLGCLQLTQDIKPAFDWGGREHVAVGTEELGIRGHLEIFICGRLRHGLSSGLVIDHNSFIICVHQQQIQDAYQHKICG
jgi:hypothetical protein